MTNLVEKPPKERTTSQLWARREIIGRKIMALTAEREEIDRLLAAELQKK